MLPDAVDPLDPLAAQPTLEHIGDTFLRWPTGISVAVADLWRQAPIVAKSRHPACASAAGSATRRNSPSDSVLRMEWTADVSAGDWLRERIDDPWHGTMHDVVPRGFDAYARVFHPVSRERPAGRDWPPLPFARHAAQWDAFHAASPEIVGEPVTWAQTATAMGTAMHALAQWRALIAPGVIAQNEDFARDPAGWRYIDPREGQLEPTSLAAVAGVLTEHTTTPGSGFAALWEGWGGVTGGMGYGASRVLFSPAGQDDPRHAGVLGRSARDVFNDVFRRPQWQPGILSDEISRGPRFKLPDRAYVLFRAATVDFADPGWILTAPWRDRASEEHGFAADAESPSLLWPEDRAWVLVSEVDFDSTIVAGSHELVRALCGDARLEALPIGEGSSLSPFADGANG